MLDGDGEVSAGDILVYTVTVENTGNITLRSIFLVDNLTDLASNTRSYDGIGLDYNDDSTMGSPFRTLKAGEVATYTATYTVVGADVTAGGILNQVVATSYHYPNGVQTILAEDTSDDGDDDDGNTEDDQTITFTGQLNSFEVIKTAAKVDDGNGVDNIGDQIVFTITVSNTGADQINDLTFTDTLTSARGVPLSLDSQPVFVSGTNGSTATTLALGGVITYTATFTVTQQVLDEGGVYNTITFSGSSARNPNPAEHDTEDVSDNGDDDDGNTEDDPTFFAVGVDNDQDGIPDLLDIDDDNDGVLDTFEKCIDFSIDGVSFENFDTGGGPVNANANYNSTFPVANVVAPFTSVDGRGRIWDTRFVNGKNWTPQDGTFFMELLQSATISGTVNPANTQAYWNESSYGIADFDRIMVQEYVYPNTTYNLTFYHMDGGISSATFADGGSTLVQVQGMDSDYQVSQLTEAPNDWTQQTFQFTTGPTTNKIAILFSAYSDGSDVAILLDNIGLTPQVSINCDVDGDGVGNGIDLDSDNDGIYDVVEAGNADLDTNGDGMIDENDAGFVDANANGAHDTIEGRTPTDTDGDTTVDMFDLDSDDDGCNDVIEAGYSDPNLDGLLGDNPVTVDANGKVTSGVDGYTTPLDQNSNNVQDYVDINWDVNCLNPGLSISKSANPIDLDGDGLIQLNDQIVYTIIVTNTSAVSVTYTLSDNLTNQESQTILNPELVWSSTSTFVTVPIPFNYVAKSSNFSYSGNQNYSHEANYWHSQYAASHGANGVGTTEIDHYIDYSRVPIIPDTYIYFDTSSGASLANTAFPNTGIIDMNQYIDDAGGFARYQVGNNSDGQMTYEMNWNDQAYYNSWMRLWEDDSYNNDNEAKTWFYEEVSGLEPNTEYTASVFVKPLNTNSSYFGFGYDRGFFIVFHDDNNGNWSTSYLTNWDNAQKSTRYYFDSYKIERISHTFTTGNNPGTTRVGLQLPYSSGAGNQFYGFQLEKGSKMSPIYTYTYTSTPDVSAAPPLLLSADPQDSYIDPGVSATYIVTLTLDQSIIDSAQELYNQVTADIEFVTPSGVTVTMTSVSDDPSTPQQDDPTYTNLDNLKGIEVIKEVESITDSNGNNLTDAGDVVTYKVTINNTGQTNLEDFELTDVLQTSTGTKTIQIKDPIVARGQNYFWYSWAIDDNNWGWTDSGSIEAWENNDNAIGGIPYHLLNYDNSNYVYDTMEGNNTTRPSSGVTIANYDTRTRPWSVYTNGTSEAYDDDYVYKTMRLKPNTTYTISVYGRKTNGNNAPFRFVIHDGRDNTYNWADAIKSDEIQLDQTNNLNRYTFTFTTDAGAGTNNARVGIHPPGSDCSGCSRFWGIQLQEGAQATTFIYNWNQNASYNWVNETVDGVTYGYSSYGDLVLELYDENASTDETPYSYWHSSYPDGNASGRSTNSYDYAAVRPDWNNFQMINTRGRDNYPAIIEIEGAISSTDVGGAYNYLGEYEGHHYFESTFSDSWWDHANRINNQEFAAYGDKAYLYIPNSNQEHVVWLKPKLSTTNNWHWIGIYQNQRYSSYSNYKTGWTDVKGNLLLGSSSGTEYVTTIPADGSVTFTFDYTITTEDMNAGVISNSLIVTSRSQSVTDISDDNDDDDGNTEDDPAEVTLDQVFDLQVTKSVNTVDNDGDGIIGVGDQAVYTIIVTNTGNVDLVSLQLSDTLTDFDATTLSLDSPLTKTDSYTLEDNRSTGNSSSYSSYFEDLSGTFDGFSSDNNDGNRYSYAYFEDDNNSTYFDDAVWWGQRNALIEVDALVNTLPSVSGENYIGQYNGHSYFWVGYSNNYWSQHRDYYTRPSEGMYLLEINTIAEADWLRAQGGNGSYNGYWIGLVREKSRENDWGEDNDQGWVWYNSGVPYPAGSAGGQSSSSSATTISETTLWLDLHTLTR